MRTVRWAEHVARIKERRSAYRILIGKRDGKKTHGRPRSRWEDNTETDLQEK
jgi:hypothetical protein